MSRRQHQPQRICIVCREKKDKRDLIRIVRTPTGQVMVDPTGKANGRGMYLCHKTECWDKGLKKERLAHALKLSLSAEEISALRQSLSQ